MDYSKKLQELISAGDDKVLMDWIEAQPLILQPDIMREFKDTMAKLFEEQGLVEELELLKEFEKGTDKYEQAILDEQLAALKVDMAIKQADKSNEEMIETVALMREYVIECITTKADNADAMRELSVLIIKFEKDAGRYNPENWKSIL